MPSERWSDSDLRDYIVRATNTFSLFPDEEWDERRARFRAEVARVIPAVQSRVLAEVGALTSAAGIALFATELVEESGGPRAWLVVCERPWEYLERWIGDGVVKAYRKARFDGDDDELTGIGQASSRRELGPALD
jgi:hypothetical protein